jgi:hypothetical protein
MLAKFHIHWVNVTFSKEILTRMRYVSIFSNLLLVYLTKALLKIFCRAENVGT